MNQTAIGPRCSDLAPRISADDVHRLDNRIGRETESACTRVLLEQAFSPTVAQYILQHPDSLAGQQREVTLLFADLCGFTSLAETLSPIDCFDMLASVMELLTEIVATRHGIVVDYLGDGLLAMWNAPLEQADHAMLACSAAQEMLDSLPKVSKHWRDCLSGPLQLGIGLHTGQALVGNAGTRSRIKYGPRGHAVHVANRVQAAGKQLQLPLVVTKATHDQRSDDIFGQRICTAKLPGLEQELDLYTIYPAGGETQLQEQLDRYAEALEWFEAGNLVTAERLLADLAAEGGMSPARFLADYTAVQLRAVHSRRVSDQSAFSQGPVIELAGK
jgi:adenylate cyclase